ncbi:TPA: hypothetical protein ACKRZL_001637, partial [Pseudomonas aeruginosa]
SEGVGATAAALVDLSTVAGNKISNPPWVKFQSAGWVNFPSAPTTQLSRVSIRCWLTEYFCADIAYIPIFALDSKNDFHDYLQAANPNRT